MTLENWNNIFFVCLRSSVPKYITLIFMISWIFIGNYVLLNLFLAILLDGFAKENAHGTYGKLDDDEEEEEEEEGQTELQVNDPKSAGISHSIIDSRLPALSSQKLQRKSSILDAAKNAVTRVRDALINRRSFMREAPLVVSIPDRFETDYSLLDKFKEKYKAIECENSFFIFPKRSYFRRLCFFVANHPWFEKIIFFLIFCSSLKLILDTYEEEKELESYFSFYSDLLDYTLNALFILEVIIRAIGSGFVFDKNSYLRDSWSSLDFFIVMMSVLDMSLPQVNLEFIRIFRLFRVLRPLRFVSHNKNMKVMVRALLLSVGGIINVVIVIILIWLMFAIVGINFMKGRLGYCYGISDSYGISREKCRTMNGVWRNRDTNFDNIFNAMLTLFIISTLEAWPDIMVMFLDGNSDDEGPMENASSLMSIYFIVFVVVGSLFLMNLFIGIIFMQYLRAENKERGKYMSDDQMRWIDIQRMIIKENPDYTSLKLPQNRHRQLIFKITSDKLFTSFIIICIILNIFTMAISYEGSSPDYEDKLRIFNYFFSAIFILEALLKIIAHGMRGYFYSGWNKFDFMVVMTSIIDIVLETQNSALSFLSVGPQIGRVFRVLRVTRVLRLVRRFEGLQKIIQTTVFSLPSLLNVFALFCLFFFIFSILACFLFQDIKNGDFIDELNNFSNFAFAFATLFRCATGEQWYVLMFDTMRTEGCTPGVNCGSLWSSLFFVTFIIVCQFVMLNLFILIILQKFEENYMNPDNPVQNYNQHTITFKELWVKSTTDQAGLRLNQNKLIDFYLYLVRPLGLGAVEMMEGVKDEREKEILLKQLKKNSAKMVMKMNLKGDKEGYVYFNELLFAVMRNAYYNQIFENINKSKGHMGIEEILKQKMAISILLREEANTSVKLEKLKKNVIGSKSVALFSSKNNADAKVVNPMVRFLFVEMIFKSWIRYSKKVQISMAEANQRSAPSLSVSSEDEFDEEGEWELHLQPALPNDDGDERNENYLNTQEVNPDIIVEQIIEDNRENEKMQHEAFVHSPSAFIQVSDGSIKELEEEERKDAGPDIQIERSLPARTSIPATIQYEGEVVTISDKESSMGTLNDEESKNRKFESKPEGGVKVTNIINLNITHNYFISGKF